MSTARFTRLLAMAAASGGLALSGCGSSDQETASAESTPVASSPTTPAAGGTFKVNEAAEISFTDEAGVSSPDPITVSTRVAKITKGTSSDLAKADGSAADGTPYYVSISFKNLSDVAFDPTKMADAFGTTLSSGGPAERITVSGKFPPCEQERPTEIAAGGTVKTCTIFMAPKGDTLDEVWRRDRFGDTWTWKAS